MGVFSYILGTLGPSGFGSGSTADDVSAKHGENAKGKVVIVTGANTGIGYETARVLAKTAQTVIIACRSEKNASEAVASLKAELPDADIRAIPLDLSSFASVRSFVRSFRALDLPLHILVNNAGVMACPAGHTAEGWETQFGTNHLGHFLLTDLLMDKLESSAPSRVVVLSSAAHQTGRIDFDNLKSERSYMAWLAYGRSKIANIYHARELNRRYHDRGVTAVSVHPGVILTQLYRNTVFRFVTPVLKPLTKTVPQGAATSVWAALAPEVATEAVAGKYLADCNVEKPVALALDDEIAAKLWDFSVEAIKEGAEQAQE